MQTHATGDRSWFGPPLTLRPMVTGDLDAVMVIETAVYPFPWTHGNFVDSLAAGYAAGVLGEAAGNLLGYFVAMQAAGEMHLLNITVVPDARRRGHARAMLEHLADRCRRSATARLWLEVRESNGGAREAYRRLGFETRGVRPGYYPASNGRESAIVMSLKINPDENADALG